MSNRCLVALTGTAFGLLTTPAHAAQEMPQGIGMIADLKFVPNYLGNPLQGPQLGPIPGGLGAPQ
jgi:hypothetical protein